MKQSNMNLNYQELLPGNFAPESRVWIYQANRMFSLSEVLEVEDMVNEFVDSWHSHGVPVLGFGTVFFGQFILLIADESASGVSGCSTDSSVRLIKAIEGQLAVDLFDRQLLAFLVEGKVQLLHLARIEYALKHNYIIGESLFFDNSVSDLADLTNHWIVPAKESWLARRFSFRN